jgi:glycine betaine catabolism B
LTGRINEKMLSDHVLGLSERTIYLCGPDAFMTQSKRCLLSLEVPEEQIFYESFTVNSPVAATPDATSIPFGQNRPSTVLQIRSNTGSFEVSFAKSGKKVIADASTSLLKLAETAGVALEHECRAGSCGECMVKCLEGRVLMTEQAEIDVSDRKKGWVYACCAYPVANVVLDA